MVTAVVFSPTFTEAVAPPPLEVMTGANSFTSVSVTVMFCTVLLAPSFAVTCTA